MTVEQQVRRFGARPLSRYHKAFSSSTNNINARGYPDEEEIPSRPRRTSSSVDMGRGFIPSDVKDPKKKKLLDDLTQRIFLSSGEDKLKKKQEQRQTQQQRHHRPKYFYEKNGEQFSSNEIMNKVMTPAGDESYDTGSLKRRNPRQMYTDSAFYNPKHHPSVAEQVEMAHRLSSSLYDDGNKMSHGQEMFLKRAKKSGKWIHAEDPDFAPEDPDIPPHHDRVPNLKLVMNPEGKLHDWTDLPENELPDMTNIAAMGSTPEVAHHVIENLEQCKGRGKKESSYSPSTASSYRDLFESRRNVFAVFGRQTPVRNHDNNNYHNVKPTLDSKPRYKSPKRDIEILRSSPPKKVQSRNFVNSHFFPIKSGLSRSKTAPSVPDVVSPNVPARGSSRNVISAYENKLRMLDDGGHRPSLRNFFS